MAYTRELSFVYRDPTKIIFGENAVDDVAVEVVVRMSLNIFQ